MKKTVLSIFITLLALCTCMFTLTACSSNEPHHIHDYSTLKYDNEKHWFECECGEKNNIVAHNIKNGECICGYAVPHIHNYTELKQSTTQHWYECSCGVYEIKENHNPGAEATETTDQKCTECGYVITPALGHVHALHLTKVDAKPQSCTQEGNKEYYTCSCGKWFTDNTATTEITDKTSVVIEKDAHKYETLKKTVTEHWWECICGDKDSLEEHHGGSATCTEKAVCTDCGVEYGSLEKHNYTELKKSETQHWYECSCGAYETKENHIPGAEATETTDQKCTECNYVITPALGHVHTLHLTKVDARPQSCTQEGNKEYYTCSCGKWFTDNTATTEITDKSSVVIAKDTHKYENLKKSATQHWYECSCGAYEIKENHIPGAEATETTDQKCTECDYVITPALGHVHTLHLTKVDAKPQSCTEEGNKEYYTCSCDKWFTDNTATTEITDKSSVVIAKDSHKYETLKKTATEHWWECSCGDKDGLEEHHGGTATCTELAECDLCGAKYGLVLKHSYTNYVSNNDAKCLQDGTETAICDRVGCNETHKRTQIGSALEHNYGEWLSNGNDTHTRTCARDNTHKETKSCNGGNATCTEKAICVVCNEKYGSLKEHEYEKNIVAKTCKNGAEIRYSCNCGKNYSDKISDIVVAFELKSISQATVNGYGTYTHNYEITATGGYGEIQFKYELFSNANKTNPDDVIDFTTSTSYSLSMKGYSFNPGDYIVKITAKDNYGNQSVYRFKIADTSLMDYSVLEGHKESDIIIDKQASKNENGKQHTECTVCGEIINEEVLYASGSIGLEYLLQNGTYKVRGIGTCTDIDIVIPSMYKGVPVTSIDWYAFQNCTLIKSVTILEGVTKIDVRAFYNCSSLESVVMADSVISIGPSAFSGCSSLINVVMGTGISSIDVSAFKNCTSLKNIEIPNSVTSIGSDAFAYCDSLTSVTIPDSVTSIGDRAFAYCDSLTSIKISNSVTSIGSYAFYYCSRLTSIKYCGTKEQWQAISKGDYWDKVTGNYTITYNYTGE